MRSLFRDGNGNLEFTIVMYHPDNGQRSYKPHGQTKHAEGMIPPDEATSTAIMTHTQKITGRIDVRRGARGKYSMNTLWSLMAAPVHPAIRILCASMDAAGMQDNIGSLRWRGSDFGINNLSFQKML